MSKTTSHFNKNLPRYLPKLSAMTMQSPLKQSRTRKATSEPSKRAKKSSGKSDKEMSDWIENLNKARVLN
jgi:hypothetical protein